MDAQSENPEMPTFADLEMEKKGSRCLPENVTGSTLRRWLYRCVPLVDLLVHYEWRGAFTLDLVAGLTIAIVQVPQGMSNALIANVPPILGIYSAVFPVFMYVVFGNYPHSSMGTQTMTCLLVSGSVLEHSTVNATSPFSTYADNETTPTEVVSSLVLLVGLWLLALSLVGFGRMSWILSEIFMAAFVPGGTIHVITSQLREILGLTFPARSGPLKVIYTYVDIFEEIENTNVAALLIGLVTMAILIIHDQFVKPQVSKRCRFPIPIHLLVIVLATGLSYAFDFSATFDIATVGAIPKGFPTPTVPSASLFGKLVLDAFFIALVTYFVTLSQAKFFGIRFNYSINGTQELFAEGVSNVFGSFFQCLPTGSATPRTMLQVSVGGKTQMTSIASATLLIAVLLWIGPLFETLPNACLSAIIIVTIAELLLKLRDVPQIYKRSRVDAIYWMATFTAVLLLDVDSGLAVAILLSIPLIFYHGFAVEIREQGAVVLAEKEEVRKVEDVTIIRIRGCLSFVNFEKALKKLEGIVRTSSKDDRVIVDLTELKRLDQAAARMFVPWLLKGNKSVTSAASDQVLRMLSSFGFDVKLLHPSVSSTLQDLRLYKTE